MIFSTHPPNSQELATEVKQVHGSYGVHRTLVVLIVDEAPAPVLVGNRVRSQLHLLDGTKRLKYTRNRLKQSNMLNTLETD